MFHICHICSTTHDGLFFFFNNEHDIKLPGNQQKSVMEEINTYTHIPLNLYEPTLATYKTRFR